MHNTLAQSWHRAWEPPDDSEIHEWAGRNLVLAGAYKPKGRFSVEISRHLIAPFEALRAPQIRAMNLLAGTQTAKTLVADIYLFWSMVNDPKAFQFNWSSDDLGKDHAESRITPTIEANPILSAALSEDRWKTRTQEKQLRNGEWLYIRGGTEKNLQGKSIPRQVNDEIWQWKAGRKAEADARLSQYERDGTSKQLNIGQASEIIRSETGEAIGDEWFLESMVKASVFKWQVACEKCGAYFFPLMEEENEKNEKVFRMKWDKDGKNIRCICPACGFEMEDTDALKANWNLSGRYVLLGTEKSETPVLWRKDFPASRVTFIWGALIWLRWQMLVDEYRPAVKALKSGVTMALKKFLQKRIPDFWDEQRQNYAPPVDIRVDDYKPSVNWQVEHKIALTVDCQKNLTEFFVVIRGWANTGESRRLWRGRCNTFDEIATLQKRFGVPSPHCAFDVGYEQTQILQECARRIDAGNSWGWFGLKGVKDEQAHGFKHTDGRGNVTTRIYSPPVFPDLELGQHNHNVAQWLASLSETSRRLYGSGKLRVPMVLWSNRLAYDILARLRDGRGALWSSPADEAGQDEEKIYREQLGAKVLRTVPDSRGNPQIRWESVRPNFPDHFWDTEAESVIFASMAGCLIGV